MPIFCFQYFFFSKDIHADYIRFLNNLETYKVYFIEFLINSLGYFKPFFIELSNSNSDSPASFIDYLYKDIPRNNFYP